MAAVAAAKRTNNNKGPSKLAAKDELGLPYELIRTDMAEQLQSEVLVICKDVLQSNEWKNDQQIATKIKLTLDSSYTQSTYHVVVGNNYASSITYESGGMMFVRMMDRNILVFKSME